MANLEAIYRVIHQPSGTIVDDYSSEKSAFACVERENEEYPDSHVVVKYVRALKQAPPAAVVPEGYALVPVEPTEAMRRAGLDRLSPDDCAADFLDKAWPAMLAAAELKGRES